MGLLKKANNLLDYGYQILEETRALSMFYYSISCSYNEWACSLSVKRRFYASAILSLYVDINKGIYNHEDIQEAVNDVMQGHVRLGSYSEKIYTRPHDPVDYFYILAVQIMAMKYFSRNGLRREEAVKKAATNSGKIRDVAYNTFNTYIHTEKEIRDGIEGVVYRRIEDPSFRNIVMSYEAGDDNLDQTKYVDISGLTDLQKRDVYRFVNSKKGEVGIFKANDNLL